MLHRQVNGTEMPSGNGAEQPIHAHIGEIKKRDERIVVKFKGATRLADAHVATCVKDIFKDQVAATNVVICIK